MKIAYADPPYLGCENYYPEHEPVDHNKLIEDLMWGEPHYDGWALSCHSPSLFHLLNHYLLRGGCSGVRIGAWVKPFCSFKPNVNPAYAWEPVIFKPARARGREIDTIRDWVSANITLKKGVVGAKPPKFCFWLFDLLGLQPDDELHDLYPGTGIVTQCWEAWCEQRRETPKELKLKI